MEPTLLIKDAAALRHTFQVRKRLQLEFLAGLSKLLREYGVNANDELIGSVILAVPDELMNGSASMGLAQSSSNGKKKGVGPQHGEKGVGPQPGGGVGPQPGGGVGPQPGGGVGPQPGKKGVVGPQPGKKRRVGPQPGKKGGGKSAK